jgi:hypothetical protein
VGCISIKSGVHNYQLSLDSGVHIHQNWAAYIINSEVHILIYQNWGVDMAMII